MKKNLVLFITFLFFTICKSQIKNGIIQYGKVIATVKDFKGDAEMKAWDEKNNAAANKIEYTLNFNLKESSFFANPILLDTGLDYNMAVWNGSGVFKYYQNNATKEYRELKETKRTGKVIVNNQIITDWTLTNESKIIDGHKCYKATTPIFQSSKKLEGFPCINVWYTPEIPIGFGPLGFGGLPGLILELQNNRATYFVKTIKLNEAKEPEMDKLQFQKPVSLETFHEIFNGTLSSEQLEMIKEANEEEANKKK